jgi:hypothetical protein
MSEGTGTHPRDRRRARKTAAALAVVATFGLALPGCNQAAPPPSAEAAPPKVAARPGVSPRGASVAVVGMDGAPVETAQRFADAFGGAAKASDITTEGPDSAVYLLRGYLTASPEASSVRLTYVSDLFDRRKQRAQRITNEVVVPARGADPWAAADFAALNALAAQGAQDLAAVLTTTPEAADAAVPARAPVAGTTSVARQAPAAGTTRLGVADAH